VTGWTIEGLAAAIRAGEVSPVEATQDCLARIERLDGGLRAFITLDRAGALETARRLEAEQRRGAWRGPLHGVPLAFKDLCFIRGLPTSCGTRTAEYFLAEQDCTVVARLVAAGAVTLGKLNMTELAMGPFGDNAHHGHVRNPWAAGHCAGGSSSGSGAAVAAGLAMGALGTDTGGSIRLPAGCCGIVGLKPTYGRVSNRGVIPMAWTLDHVGPMCKTVEDAAILLGVMAGFDELDPSTVDVPVAEYVGGVGAPTAGLRLGVPTAGFFEDLNPEVAAALEAALEVLGELTAGVREVDVPAAGSVVDIWNPEIYAYHEPWITTSPALYQEPTRRLIERAEATSAADYADARRHVDILRRDIRKVFAEVDLLITPTRRVPPGLIVPSASPGNADPAGAPGGGGGGLNNTAAFNIYGLPTISVPCGFTEDGLPIGLQISGAHFDEPTVIALAHAYEQATGWHERRPNLTI